MRKVDKIRWVGDRCRDRKKNTKHSKKEKKKNQERFYSVYAGGAGPVGAPGDGTPAEGCWYNPPSRCTRGIFPPFVLSGRPFPSITKALDAPSGGLGNEDGPGRAEEEPAARGSYPAEEEEPAA